MCSCDDDYHGNRDIGSLGLWETERFCEKKLRIIKVVEGLPNLLRVFREGLA